MSRQQWLSIIGVWVIVFLYMGFPSAWDKIIAAATGLLIIFISFKMNAKIVHKDGGDSAYVENGGKSSQS
jgi:hypothetical protein